MQIKQIYENTYTDDEFPVSLEAVCLQVSAQIYRELGQYYKVVSVPFFKELCNYHLSEKFHILRMRYSAWKSHHVGSSCQSITGTYFFMKEDCYFQESNWLMQEEFQVYSLLDLIESDTYLVDLFLDFSI